jgi:hypothetical protein
MESTVERPALSVIVAAWNQPSLLRACLESLRDSEGEPFETIVVFPGGHEFGEVIRAFPGIVGVELGPSATVPQLRKAGLERVTGSIVAFLEDHAAVAAGWANALRAEYQRPARSAVGGPVAQSPTASALDWGAYLFDYGRFMPPQTPGIVGALSGLNMSFSRALLDSLDSEMAQGVFEGPIHAELARRNERPFMAPAAIVHHNKRYSLREAFVSVYYLGRGYAGRRVESAGRVVRLARAASCVALPAVLVWRPLSAALRSGRDIGPVLGSLGYLSLLALSWSSGECIGYLFGRGDSDSRWR